MDGVGPGTVIDGRYTVGSLTREQSGAQRWEAEEPDLGRSVALLVLPADDPRAEALLDAGRVAAGLQVPGSVRVLDLGRDERVVWIVEESLTDADSLEDLVRAGGLTGDEARRIAGETATTLEAAASRGVHHLVLTPDQVFRTTEGAIKVRGLATEAVLTGAADASDAGARDDAVGLVALTYAALTGRWPLDRPSGLDPAPRLVRGVPAPSEIAAGVPRDLDTLCRQTLAESGGPLSPGDFARQISPWSSRPIEGRSTLGALPDATGATDPPAGAGDDTPAAPTPAAPAPGDDRQAPQDASTDHDPSPGTSPPAPSPAAPPREVSPVTAPPPAPTAGTPPEAPSEAPPARPAPVPRALPGVGRDGPPAPGVPEEPLTRDQSRLALGIVLALVIAALAIGLRGVSKIGENTDLDLSGGTTRVEKTPSAPAPTPDEGERRPLAILSADGFDPLGDKKENNQLAPKVFDGDPTSVWTSEGYESANLGGIKSGVGVIVDIGPNVTAADVTLTLGAPSNVEVFLAAERSLDGALKIGEQADANGVVTFEAPPDAGPRQYVIVWFTSAAPAQDGRFRAVLGEVGVRG